MRTRTYFFHTMCFDHDAVFRVSQVCCFIYIFIMSNSNLFIVGSIHQGNEGFSEISRGWQCSFMSFSAILYAQSLPISQWQTSTVDQILTQGDKMYLDALERQVIPDAETISLTYLPNKARWPLPIVANKSHQSPDEAHKRNKSPDEAQRLLIINYHLIISCNKTN